MDWNDADFEGGVVLRDAAGGRRVLAGSLENGPVLVRATRERVEGGVIVRARLEAREDVLLDRWTMARLPIRWRLERTRFFQNGFQSWTPTRSLPALAAPDFPRLRSFELMNHFVDSPLWRRQDGLLSSLFTALVDEESGRALVAGFLRQEAGLGEAFLERGTANALEMSLDYGGKRLRQGQSIEAEPLLLLWGSEAHELLDRYAERAAAEMHAPASNRPSLVGWCSWYEFYTRVREQDALANVEALSRKTPAGLEVVQLDDGYQTQVGDWLSTNRKFPNGLEPLTRAIRERGWKAGLWLAPFFVSPRSRLAREHPDWLLRTTGRAARPVDCGFNPLWLSRTWALDLSHPEVLAWLRATFQALCELGFDYFKIDFLFAGLRHGARFNPGLSPVEAYRAGLAAIREAIGPDRFLLGCGAPLGPSVGYVDGMRVSADVKEEWHSRVLGWLGRGCAVPSLRDSLLNNLTRAFLHRRWWLNDPDCFLVRDRRSSLSPDEVRLLVTAFGMTGGLAFLSDDFERLAPERYEWLEAVLPPSNLRPQAPDFLTESWPRSFEIHGPGQVLRAWLQWDAQPRVQKLTPSPAHRFDFWSQSFVETDTISIPAHGVRVLLETGLDARPAIAGTDLHLLAPLDGRLRCEARDGILLLEASGFPRARGSIWIALPEGWSLELPPGGHAETTIGGHAETTPGGPSPLRAIRTWPGGSIVTVDRAPPWRLELPIQIRTRTATQ